MTDSVVIGLLRQMLTLAALLAGPLLLVSMVVGVVISLVQAVTQIQDMTLTFVPKVLALALTLLLLGSWMLQQSVTFTTELFRNLPSYIR
ncbi:MAG TPA: flagellar biosynthesis protein FliQ [Armatimonadota bacterium]